MKISPLSWIFVALTLVIAFLLAFNPEVVMVKKFFLVTTVLTAGLIFFFLKQQIGLTRALYLLMLAGVIGFIMELLGVHGTTFFSEYSYTDFLGYKISGVPVMIAIAWFLATTTAFMAARLVLGFGKKIRPLRLFSLAALFAVIFDLPVEYMAKHVWSAWEWGGTGPILGVPTMNYLAWFVVAFLIYGLGSSQWRQINRTKRGYRDLQIVCFVSFGLLIFHLVLDVMNL